MNKVYKCIKYAIKKTLIKMHAVIAKLIREEKWDISSFLLVCSLDFLLVVLITISIYKGYL